ncbi:MAG TPA: hypothetical protein DCQ50_09600 [Chryseobacterium sp.]|nr:hypothetical protein [Chryseobacterium sp.]
MPQFAGVVRSMAKSGHRIKPTFAGVRNPATVLREKLIKVDIDYRVSGYKKSGQAGLLTYKP